MHRNSKLIAQLYTLFLKINIYMQTLESSIILIQKVFILQCFIDFTDKKEYSM